MFDNCRVREPFRVLRCPVGRLSGHIPRQSCAQGTTKCPIPVHLMLVWHRSREGWKRRDFYWGGNAPNGTSTLGAAGHTAASPQRLYIKTYIAVAGRTYCCSEVLEAWGLLRFFSCHGELALHGEKSTAKKTAFQIAMVACPPKLSTMIYDDGSFVAAVE